jgi:hypothetical protein
VHGFLGARGLLGKLGRVLNTNMSPVWLENFLRPAGLSGEQLNDMYELTVQAKSKKEFRAAIEGKYGKHYLTNPPLMSETN